MAEHDDLWRWRHTPAELAVELRDEGFAGMKVWPFDDAAEDQGRLISAGALRAGTAVLEVIRGTVGGNLEIMLEGMAGGRSSRPHRSFGRLNR